MSKARYVAAWPMCVASYGVMPQTYMRAVSCGLVAVTERADEWQDNLARLRTKFETARTLVPQPVLDEVDGAEIGIISYGSNDPGIVEARAMLAARGVATSYLRLRALPTTAEFNAFVARYPHVYVVENNFDGQMHNVLQTEVPEHAARLRSIAQCDGLPLTGRWIARSIVSAQQEW